MKKLMAISLYQRHSRLNRRFSFWWRAWQMVLGFCFFVALPLSAQETFTLTTYYPAPFGVYQELRSRRMAVGANVLSSNSICWGASCPAGSYVIGDNVALFVDGAVNLQNQSSDQASSPLVFDISPTVGGGYIYSTTEGGSFTKELNIVLGNNSATNPRDHVDAKSRITIAVNDSLATGLVGDIVLSAAAIRTPVGSRIMIGSTASAPQATLDVAGGVKIADDTANCDVNKAGTMRYNSDQIQYCNGKSWQSTFASRGPTFITPVLVTSDAKNDTMFTYDASAYIPASGKVAILEVSVASGSDVFTKQAFFRPDVDGPTVELRSSTFNITTQILCPLSAGRTFQYLFNNTSSIGVPGGYPANRIRLIGYY